MKQKQVKTVYFLMFFITFWVDFELFLSENELFWG